MQDALEDIFGSMFEAMLQGEMNNHLGYESNDHGIKRLIIDATVIRTKRSKRVPAK